MAYKSPFADPTAVRKIANDLKSLSTKSVNVEESIYKAKGSMDDLVNQYRSDFDILNKIPSFFDQFAVNLRKQNNTARDVAKKIQSLFDDYGLVLEAIETVTSKEEAKDIIEAFNEDIQSQNPLKKTPLEGFQGVSNAFNYIWNLKIDESKHIVKVLGNATDIKKTVKELITELKPVKGGIANIQTALKEYASHIQN